MATVNAPLPRRANKPNYVPRELWDLGLPANVNNIRYCCPIPGCSYHMKLAMNIQRHARHAHQAIYPQLCNTSGVYQYQNAIPRTRNDALQWALNGGNPVNPNITNPYQNTALVNINTIFVPAPVATAPIVAPVPAPAPAPPTAAPISAPTAVAASLPTIVSTAPALTTITADDNETDEDEDEDAASINITSGDPLTVLANAASKIEEVIGLASRSDEPEVKAKGDETILLLSQIESGLEEVWHAIVGGASLEEVGDTMAEIGNLYLVAEQTIWEYRLLVDAPPTAADRTAEVMEEVIVLLNEAYRRAGSVYHD